MNNAAIYNIRMFIVIPFSSFYRSFQATVPAYLNKNCAFLSADKLVSTGDLT